jgi:hypothetical protein
MAERKRFKDQQLRLEEDCRRWKSRYLDAKKVAERVLAGGTASPNITQMSGLFEPASRASATRIRPQSATAAYSRQKNIDLDDPVDETPPAGSSSPPKRRSMSASPHVTAEPGAHSAAQAAARSVSPAPRPLSHLIKSPPLPSGNLSASAAGADRSAGSDAGPGGAPNASRAFRTAAAATLAVAAARQPISRGGSFSESAAMGGDAGPRSGARPQRRLSLILAATSRRRPSVSTLGEDPEAAYLARTGQRWHRVLRVSESVFLSHT